MEPNGTVRFHHRRSASSDRFLDVFSPPKSGSVGDVESLTDDELIEAEVFWTGENTEPNYRSTSPANAAAGNQNKNRQLFRNLEKFGILAALPEDNRKPSSPVIYRKPSISSSSRMLPAIPKPPQEREYSQSVPSGKSIHSAPMNVPVMKKKLQKGELAEVDLDDEEDDEILPPHEIVARGSAKSPKTTFSVLEGVGRTLKGRDLRQVRNAVWHQTGFLD